MQANIWNKMWLLIDKLHLSSQLPCKIIQKWHPIFIIVANNISIYFYWLWSIKIKHLVVCVHPFVNALLKLRSRNIYKRFKQENVNKRNDVRMGGGYQTYYLSALRTISISSKTIFCLLFVSVSILYCPVVKHKDDRKEISVIHVIFCHLLSLIQLT